MFGVGSDELVVVVDEADVLTGAETLVGENGGYGDVDGVSFLIAVLDLAEGDVVCHCMLANWVWMGPPQL